MTNNTLKDESKNYVAPKTLNITDLDRVDLSWPVTNEVGKDAEGQPFNYKSMNVNGISYRVPGPVMDEINKMLLLKPDLAFVKVTKTGSGLGTRYSVKMVE